MAKRHQSPARIVALIVLVVVVAAALRGYVPGGDVAPRERTGDSPVGLGFVGVLLAIALVVMAAAVVSRVRDRRPSAASTAGRQDWLRGGTGGKVNWRYPLVAFVVGVVWLVVVALLTQLTNPDGPLPASPAPTFPTAGPGPDADGEPPPTTTERPADDDRDLTGYFTAGTAVFLLMLAAGAVVARRRDVRGAEPPVAATEGVIADDVDAPTETLARAAEVGLAAVGDPSREPRKAIIACYAAMERQLADVPGAAPQDFDTASEVLARAVEHHALQPDSATQLVDLFDEARFSPHLMTEEHRDTAVRILEFVLAELRSRV